MKAFLAVCVAAPASRHATPDPAVAGAVDPAARSRLTGDGWLAHTEAEPGDVITPEGVLTLRLTRSIRTRTADVATDALADWLGLRQLYWWQGDGVAAVATSALALARLAGQGLDRRHLALQSLVGWQLGSGTVFASVHKLPPGSAAVLHAGKVQRVTYVDQLSPGRDEGLAPVVAEMATILRQIHHAYLSDHPDTVLQLSGGQDSRILLCAIPPEQRVGLHALTLDTHGGPEWTVARRLADLAGLKHEVHWLDEQPPPDAEQAHALVDRSARALDGMASPLALAALLHAESALDQGHRLSGAGGETARGFYYPGQPHHAATSAPLVDRIADWRLFANEAVEPAALDPSFGAGARADALELVRDEFATFDRDWLRATDDLYLYGRTSRWAGVTGTVAAVQRHFVNPLLDRRVMELALTPDPALKRDSRLTAALMRHLDPQLAAVPLDSGLVPDRLALGGLAARVAVARHTARKAARKVRQRLGNTRRAQLGATAMAALVLAHWRANPELLDPVRATGVIEPGFLVGLLAGQSVPATTVAFLANLAVVGEVA